MIVDSLGPFGHDRRRIPQRRSFGMSTMHNIWKPQTLDPKPLHTLKAD